MNNFFENVENKVNNIYRSFDHLSISIEEKDKLISEGFTLIQIDSVLDRIENYKANKKYKSLLLTARNWLKKELPDVKPKVIDGVQRFKVKFRNNPNEFTYTEEQIKAHEKKYLTPHYKKIPIK